MNIAITDHKQIVDYNLIMFFFVLIVVAVSYLLLVMRSVIALERSDIGRFAIYI